MRRVSYLPYLVLALLFALSACREDKTVPIHDVRVHFTGVTLDGLGAYVIAQSRNVEDGTLMLLHSESPNSSFFRTVDFKIPEDQEFVVTVNLLNVKGAATLPRGTAILASILVDGLEKQARLDFETPPTNAPYKTSQAVVLPSEWP